MENSKLVLKSINQLLDYNFLIPSYQRGYRWTDIEVEHLLNDIDSLVVEQINETEKKTWYCLQPLVVKLCNDLIVKEHNLDNNKNWYEVIDGQQRLTTIYLILHYINQGFVENRRKQLFDIKYSTRISSQEFLREHIDHDNIDKSNVDFYNMSVAYKTIYNWFSEKEKDNKFDTNNFTSKLSFHTNFIWYEIDANSNSDSYEIFTRLNTGKIPLTNSELIKALFLKKWNLKENIDLLRLKQLKISSEWDKIENTLNDTSFWHFIYNKSEPVTQKYSNHIEYIFDIMTEKQENKDDRFTFYKFNEKFEKSKQENANGLPDIESIWLEVKRYFSTFEEWYKDRTLYHYIGFLINDNYSVLDLIIANKGMNKIDFRNHLKKLIKEKINYDVSKLDYDKVEDRKKIKNVLLLFNIETILGNDNSNLRFPFDLYKLQDWDIEHVRSQTDKELKSLREKQDWAKDIIKYYTGLSDIEEQERFVSKLDSSKYKEILKTNKLENIQSVLSDLIEICRAETLDEIGLNLFNKIYDQICIEFKEKNEPSKCSISNLALLDSKTNRSYKNAPFPIKREIILESDKKGTFIPICTKNVFTKAYSKRFDEIMYWNNEDANYYLKAIEETLINYLSNGDVQNGY